jgi:hypothetical protein
MLLIPAKEQKRYWRNGAGAWYRSFITVFPYVKIRVIVFSSPGDFDTDKKSEKIEYLF